MGGEVVQADGTREMVAEMDGKESELGGSEEAFGNYAEEENFPNSDGLDGPKVQGAWGSKDQGEQE